jgi:hypothetical protein
MGYVNDLYRCNINAQTPGEILVNTVWMRQDAGSVPNLSPQQVADRVRDAWTNLINVGSGPFAASVPLRPYFADDTVWTSVTAYKVNALGKAVDQAEAAFVGVDGQGSQALPPQCALVVTLLTGAPGRSARGRMFLGGLSTFLTPQGRVLPASQQIITDAMASFYVQLRQTNNAPDVVRPVVVSPTTTTARKITRVQVGNVIDTMRSRRGKLVEARIARPVDE